MNLFDAMLDLARTAGLVREGEASGGTTTKLEDSTQKINTGTFPGGTIFFLSGDNAGCSRPITAYDFKTFTFFPATDKAGTPLADNPIDAGNRYAVADKDYPRDLLIQAVNAAIRLQYPQKVQVLKDGNNDIVTIAKQEEYTFTNALPGPILRVEIATDTAAPYGWQINRHWEQFGQVLMFDEGFIPATADLPMRLTCKQEFTDLTEDDDAIPQVVDLNRMHWQAVVELSRRGLLLYQSDPERQLTNILNEAYAQLERCHKQPPPVRDSRLANW